MAGSRSGQPGMAHPEPDKITIKPPHRWTLMGTEQKNLDVPSKVTGQAVYGIDVRLPGMKWAAVRNARSTAATSNATTSKPSDGCPAHVPRSSFHPDPALTRGRVFSGGVAVIADTWHQARTAIDKMPIEWDVPPANAAFTTATVRCC